MGEPAEDYLRNEYYELIHTVFDKRTFYPENCASLLYKTLKAEESALNRAVGLVELPDKDNKNLTNVLAKIQTVSLMSNKVLEEFPVAHLKQEDLQKRCDSALAECKEAHTALTQIKNEPNEFKYC